MLIKFTLRILLYVFYFLNNCLLRIKSIIYTKLYVDEGKGKILFKTYSSKLKIIKDKKSFLILNDNLILDDIFFNNDPILIRLSSSSFLKIEGEITLGNGVKLILAENSYLSFYGKKNESASGITGNTIIMVKEKIEIGYDFICAWDSFITDSDWHETNALSNTKPVKIGNHVWVTRNCSILKGSIISDNCILASGTVINDQSFSESTLIGGMPAKSIKSGVKWRRELND